MAGNREITAKDSHGVSLQQLLQTDQNPNDNLSILEQSVPQAHDPDSKKAELAIKSTSAGLSLFLTGSAADEVNRIKEDEKKAANESSTCCVM